MDEDLLADPRVINLLGRYASAYVQHLQAHGVLTLQPSEDSVASALVPEADPALPATTGDAVPSDGSSPSTTGQATGPTA